MSPLQALSIPLINCSIWGKLSQAQFVVISLQSILDVKDPHSADGGIQKLCCLPPSQDDIDEILCQFIYAAVQILGFQKLSKKQNAQQKEVKAVYNNP